MDTTAAGIVFDADGVCNYCTDFLRDHGKYVDPDPVSRQAKLDALVAEVRAAGAGKRYDCIVGISGGVDSSWTLVQTVKLGLRPLAVHMDSGWNSELAQNNIANLVRALGIDLYTHVINWPEIRGLMEAFFSSDVIDIEVLYDNAMLALNYQMAAKHGVRHILAGTNMATEGMRMPDNWNWLKYDRKNIIGISKAFGGPKLKTFPSIGTFQMIDYVLRKRIRWISFLDLLDYRKLEALKVLEAEYGYKPYQFKHYESVFTRFYQGYILPNKFGVDKRKLHASTLVMNGDISHEEALEQISGIAYPSERDQEKDKQYFIKKMLWSPEKLDAYIARPERPHTDYPSERRRWEWFQDMYRLIFRRNGIRT